MNRNLLITLVAVVVVVIGGVYVVAKSGHLPKTQGPVACTTEARICPDGSAVGRTGPNCEFAPCPTGTSDNNSNTTTTTGTTVDNNSLVQGAFNTSTTLAIGQTARFPDGLLVKLTSINDSRCPAGVQCIWQGELVATLVLSGGGLSTSTTLRLGTERNKSASAGDSEYEYTVTLTAASPSSATIRVERAVAGNTVDGKR